MKLTKVIKWFGATILCYPADALFTCGRDTFSETIIQLVRLVAQIILLVSPCVISLVQFQSSPYVGPKPPLSARIETGIFYLSTVLPYVIIRGSSILFRDDIIKLHAELETFPTGAGTNWTRRKIFLGTITALSSLWFCANVLSMIRLEVSIQYIQGCNVFSLPCDDIKIRAAFLFADLSVVVTVFYAWSCVNLCGVSLMNCLNELTANCESSFNGDVAPQRKMNGISIAAGDKTILKIVEEFRSVKVNFERYSKIGGAFSLALLIHFALTAIGVLSFLFAGIPDSSWDEFPLRHSTALCFPSLFAVVYFGDYVTQAVSSSKIYLKNGDLPNFIATSENECFLGSTPPQLLVRPSSPKCLESK